jgi:hypothetical protein
MAQLPVVTGLTARYIGVAGGSTTWYYWVQAIYDSGIAQLSSPGNTGAKAQSSLSQYGFNQVQWAPAPGAIGYLVWRNTTGTTPQSGGTLLAVLTSETGIKDDGSWTSSTAVPRYDGIYVAHMLYDFSVDGGDYDATGFCVPSISDTIPSGAIVFGGICYGVVDLVGPTAVELGTSAGSSQTSIMGSTAIASVNDHFVELLGVNSQAATNEATFQMTAAGQIRITFTVADVTAGIVEAFVFYVMPSNVAPS